LNRHCVEDVHVPHRHLEMQPHACVSEDGRDEKAARVAHGGGRARPTVAAIATHPSDVRRGVWGECRAEEAEQGAAQAKVIIPAPTCSARGKRLSIGSWDLTESS
jgi:hypothetical protein